MIHEIITIAGTQDDDYWISSSLTSLLKDRLDPNFAYPRSIALEVLGRGSVCVVLGKPWEKNGDFDHDPALDLARACRDNDFDGVLDALKKGASLKKQVSVHQPLLEATINGNTDIVRLLVELHKKLPALFDVNQVTMYDSTPLHLAAFTGQIEIVRALLSDPRINVNAQDKDGKTPLMHAIQAERIDAIKMLLETQKVDLTLVDRGGATAEVLIGNMRDRYREKATEILTRYKSHH